MEVFDTVVVGAGQAGLATSHELKRRNVDHVVLERGDIAQSWADRWDSFCLVTPNWTVQLPGYFYDRDDPDGFMPRDEIVAYMKRYAASFDAPVRTGVNVTSVQDGTDRRFEIVSDQGVWSCNNLVLSTGAYQKPHLPDGANTLPQSITALRTDQFTHEKDLPDGDILIVGSGQTGCQIAEELNEAGRHVVLSCGRVPWGPRKIGGKDIFHWLISTGFTDQKSADIPPEARLLGNVLATGHDGGHDLSLRLLQDAGVVLVGHFLGAEGTDAKFAPDLAQSVAWGDEKYSDLMTAIGTAAGKMGEELDPAPMPEPFDDPGIETMDLSSFGAVIFTGGFRPDYKSWLPWQEAFDDHGFPLQADGKSEVVDGLYFTGVHLLRKRKSALLYGVGEDAEVVADQIAKAGR